MGMLIILQYCAKVTQAKCANFVLCPCELSKKVYEKVRVTIQGLLNEISFEQRTLFRRLFGTKRYFTITSIVSLTQCPKFRFKQTQQFFTQSFLIYLSYKVREVYISFSMHFLTGVQSRKERMRITVKLTTSQHLEFSFIPEESKHKLKPILIGVVVRYQLCSKCSKFFS